MCLIVACWHCQHWLLEAVAKAAEGASAGSVAAILKPDISPLHLSVIMGFCARFAATCGHLIATDFPHSVSPALHAYFKALHGLVPGAQGQNRATILQHNWKPHHLPAALSTTHFCCALQRADCRARQRC